MFNIKTFSYQFSDVIIYCVGEESNINLLYQYYKIHEKELEPQNFAKRIIHSKVYAYIEGNTPKAIIACDKYNKRLKQAGFLMDIEYYEEAMLIENPIKVIEFLELQELYNQEIEISEYWRERFSTLPEKFVITSSK